MKKITINKKEYTFEFTIEASLYDECTMAIMDMSLKSGMAQGAASENDVDGAMQNLAEAIANLPQKALTLFYAGLLEHHGSEGDGSIQSKAEAKKLLAIYLKEKNKSFRDVLGEMMELMNKDSFFELIGLNQITAELGTDTNTAGKDTSEK